MDGTHTNESSDSHHGHHRIQANKESLSRLRFVLVLTFAIMIAEIVVGNYIQSLALLADGTHMITDVVSLFIAILGVQIATKEQDERYTFGFRRVEVLSGFINGATILIVSVYILIEAVNRMFSSGEVHISGPIMFVTAIAGLLANFAGIRILKESNDNISVEGAYAHVMADMLGSISAVIASLAILFFDAYWMDLVTSILISILILKSGIELTWKSTRIILEASPDDKDVNQILTDIMSIGGVKEVHDLHCWSLTSGTDLITGHITIEESTNSHDILATVMEIAKNHGYEHPTFQIELDSCVEISECYPFTKDMTI